MELQVGRTDDVIWMIQIIQMYRYVIKIMYTGNFDSLLEHPRTISDSSRYHRHTTCALEPVLFRYS